MSAKSSILVQSSGCRTSRHNKAFFFSDKIATYCNYENDPGCAQVRWVGFLLFIQKKKRKEKER